MLSENILICFPKCYCFTSRKASLTSSNVTKRSSTPLPARRARPNAMEPEHLTSPAISAPENPPVRRSEAKSNTGLTEEVALLHALLIFRRLIPVRLCCKSVSSGAGGMSSPRGDATVSSKLAVLEYGIPSIAQHRALLKRPCFRNASKWICKISLRPCRSGSGISICTSKRPLKTHKCQNSM